MEHRFARLILGLSILCVSTVAQAQTNDRARLDQIQESLKSSVPRVLCLDEKFATGGQPTAEAYTKAANSGFQSVLSLRAANEGVDLNRERGQVEAAKLRYYNIPVDGTNPRPDQADKFRRLVKNPANHPMLINCASANRVGAFMMVYRVVDQGWSEDKALAEAERIGMRGEALKNFAIRYIAQQKNPAS